MPIPQYSPVLHLKSTPRSPCGDGRYWSPWRRLAAIVVALSCWVAACGAPGEPMLGGDQRMEEIHGEALDSVSTVPAFRLRGVSELELAKIWLVAGSLSKSSLGRILQGDVPSTVSERRVALALEREEDWIRAVPLAPLEPGAEYTFFAVSAGELATFTVMDGEGSPLLRRIGSGPLHRGEFVHYCEASLRGAHELRSIRGEAPLRPLNGELGEHCVALAIPKDAPVGPFRPPLLHGEERLSPEPLIVEEGDAPSCDGTLPFVAWRERGGRLEGTLGEGFTHISVMDAGTHELIVSQAVFLKDAAPLAVGPVPGNSDIVVSLSGITSGCLGSSTMTLTTASPAPNFQLTEVLADPLGPEPASEWVELKNVGNAEGSLLGYSLQDSSGETPLPDARIPADGYGLIVSSDFVVNEASDPIPAAAAVRVEVKELGFRGLSNSGERLVLLGPSGDVLSTLPALPASAGKSWFRVGVTEGPESFAMGEPTPGR